MKQKYRLFKRASGVFYVEDVDTRVQESLKTKDRVIAKRLWSAKNESHLQPALNFQLARAYLSASDPATQKRTWQDAMAVLISMKTGSTRERWLRAAQDRALSPLLSRILVETQAEHLVVALKAGTVSTNVHLRKLHNFCLDMNWIPVPIIPRKQWPAIIFGEKRAITWDEHLRIIDREPNPENKAFYELAWHLGAAQGDLANLTAEDVVRGDRVIAFHRRKTGSTSLIRFGRHVELVLKRLPKSGFLFPKLQSLQEKRRADYFRKRCLSIGITGVTLHSYRYAWAERAKIAGYPERFAQEALGHNSKAVHRAYARKAQVQIPALEEFESKIVRLTRVG